MPSSHHDRHFSPAGLCRAALALRVRHQRHIEHCTVECCITDRAPRCSMACGLRPGRDLLVLLMKHPRLAHDFLRLSSSARSGRVHRLSMWGDHKTTAGSAFCLLASHAYLFYCLHISSGPSTLVLLPNHCRTHCIEPLAVKAFAEVFDHTSTIGTHPSIADLR